MCIQLLKTLKGVQSGKIKDTFGWNSVVKEVNAQSYEAGEVSNGVNGQNPDKLP